MHFITTKTPSTLRRKPEISQTFASIYWGFSSDLDKICYMGIS